MVNVGLRFVLSLLSVLHNVVHVTVALLGGGAGDELRVYNNLQPVQDLVFQA